MHTNFLNFGTDFPTRFGRTEHRPLSLSVFMSKRKKSYDASCPLFMRYT